MVHAELLRLVKGQKDLEEKDLVFFLEWQGKPIDDTRKEEDRMMLLYMLKNRS